MTATSMVGDCQEGRKDPSTPLAGTGRTPPVYGRLAGWRDSYARLSGAPCDAPRAAGHGSGAPVWSLDEHALQIAVALFGELSTPLQMPVNPVTEHGRFQPLCARAEEPWPPIDP